MKKDTTMFPCSAGTVTLPIMERVKTFITSYELLPELEEAPTIIVGFSGGPDSVVLVHILQKMKYKPILTHCNFHLRGEESDRDEQFCRDFAKKNKLKIVVKDFYPMDEIAKGGPSSVETVCRNMRYKWWREEFLPDDIEDEYDEANSYTLLCLGHHLDDSIETVLINFMRGTGLDGMTGIPADNGWIRRPLLCLTRAEIMEYIRDNGLTYVTDSTNGTDMGLRNQIRGTLIPMMEKILPQARRGMTQTISHLNDMAFFLEQGTDNALEGVMDFTRDGHAFRAIHRDTLTDTGRCYSALYLLMKDRVDVSAPLRQNIAIAIDYGRENRIFRTDDMYATIGRQYFAFTSEPTFLTDEYTWSEESPRELPDFLSVTVASKVKEKKCRPDTAHLDLDKVTQPLHFRRWREGDRMRPFCMNGTKLVSDLFSNAHYTPLQKAITWVVEDASGNIVWVSGLRQSDDVSIDSKTRRIAIIRDLNEELPFDE